jgi:hypothetical protein
MAEKQGQTEKLIYDFNTARCCEVQLLNGEWHRVTPREFRSNSRPRRTQEIHDSKLVVQEYNGPIYFYNTNKIVKEDQMYRIGLLFIDQVDMRNSSTDKKYGRI